jgi:hypothetical protein
MVLPIVPSATTSNVLLAKPSFKNRCQKQHVMHKQTQIEMDAPILFFNASAVYSGSARIKFIIYPAVTYSLREPDVKFAEAPKQH